MHKARFEWTEDTYRIYDLLYTGVLSSSGISGLELIGLAAPLARITTGN